MAASEHAKRTRFLLSVQRAGRLTHNKLLIATAVEVKGTRLGRIRLRRIPNHTKATLHRFITQVAEPGSTIRTDGLNHYAGLSGYCHDVIVVKRQAQSASELLPHVRRVISLLKRWLLGTHKGAVGGPHLDYYLDEFAFWFNRRESASRGKLFYRLVQQAVQVSPHTVPLVGQTTTGSMRLSQVDTHLG